MTNIEKRQNCKNTKERNQLFNELESYIFQCKGILEQDNIKERISDDDKNIITDKTDEIQTRLDEEPDADLDTLEDWRKELENIVSPITTRLYQESGGDNINQNKMPSDMPGGMPDMNNTGPSVEEVD